MRKFARQSIKGGRCNVFNQHYISEILDKLVITISKEIKR